MSGAAAGATATTASLGLTIRASGNLGEDFRLLRSSGGNDDPGFSEAQLKQFQKLKKREGRRGLEKAKRSLQRRLKEHIEKIEDEKRKGGYTSAMETEVRNFERQLNAINHILGGN